jgi:ribose transport system substrate-binding protein
MNVSHGRQQAADRLGIELLVTDNCFSAEIALMNAQMFTKQGVDLVIECQVHEKMAPIIAHLLAQAAIPCIAIDIPQPGAVFFGANNYQAGLIAGHALGQYAATSWDGKFDKVLLLEAAQAGPIPQARLAGALHGIQEILGPISNTRVIRIDCRGTLRDSFALTNSVTNSLPHGSRVLIAALNDPSAVGAVRALEAAARTSEAAIVGQSATIEARLEMRRPGSCLIGSVGYFPEKYGEQIVPLAVKIIEGNTVLPAVYVEHIMVSPDNVDSLYPADAAVDATAERCLEMELINSQTTAPPQLLL